MTPMFDGETALEDVVDSAKCYASEKFFDDLLDVLINENAFQFSNILWGIATFALSQKDLRHIGLTLKNCYSEAKKIEKAENSGEDKDEE